MCTQLLKLQKKVRECSVLSLSIKMPCSCKKLHTLGKRHHLTCLKDKLTFICEDIKPNVRLRLDHLLATHIISLTDWGPRCKVSSQTNTKQEAVKTKAQHTARKWNSCSSLSNSLIELPPSRSPLLRFSSVLTLTKQRHTLNTNSQLKQQQTSHEAKKRGNHNDSLRDSPIITLSWTEPVTVNFRTMQNKHWRGSPNHILASSLENEKKQVMICIDYSNFSMSPSHFLQLNCL